MLAALFLGFVALMATLVAMAIARYIHARAAAFFIAGLLLWFGYAWGLSLAGIVQSTTMRPPGMLFLVAPIVVFLAVVIARPKWTTSAAMLVPLWLLIGAQVFRVGVEIFLHQLWHDGVIPKMLTFSGANIDIYIGLSAPLIAWISMRRNLGRGIAFLWNIAGLAALANVVMRAILTAPGPLNLIHTEVPNRLLITYPYLLVPVFFVPLAVVLHILAIRHLYRGAKTTLPVIP